jgi:stearoyl-CoA desaturase (delta-9 desaturase)
MPPNTQSQVEPEITDLLDKTKARLPFKREIVWRNVVLMSLLHLSALYGLYLCFVSAKWQTIAFGKYNTNINHLQHLINYFKI